MVIEDDHDTRVSIRSALESAGLFCVSATNGADALTLLEKMTPPTAILLDLNMPLMNGEQFLKVVHSESKYSSIPIIQMSASLSPRLPGTCYFLKKPIELTEMLKAIERCAILNMSKTG